MQAHIFDIREDNLDSLVLQNSHKMPVFLEFMAVYSGPCITLEQTLSDYAKEFAGQFVFAKVDIDEQPELAKQFDIQNVPTLLIMQNGEITEAVEGLIDVKEAGDLLRSLGIFSPADNLRDEARKLYVQGEVAQAMSILAKASKADPRNPRVAMDMAQILIDLNQIDDATALYNQLPEKSKQTDMGRSLLGQMTFKNLANNTLGKDALLEQIQNDPTAHSARFDLAVCYVAEHQYNDAMQTLFSLYTVADESQKAATKELIVTITNMLEANDPDTAKAYRRKLANLLAS